jgi:D-alanyl-D-alanine carboxypeptidase (penicillin-binding protein 5/6)
MTITERRSFATDRPRHAPAPQVEPKRSRRSLATRLLALVALFAVVGDVWLALDRDHGRHQYLTPLGWPSVGQASYQIDGRSPASSPNQEPAPIASVAKVMTAYVVSHRSSFGPGPFLTVTPDDVADWHRRRAAGESTVRVAAGETLTERQALEALLLPSANNVAVMIARRVSGTVAAFLVLMNATARTLGMTHTTYTDPSGLDEGTVSTAADQLRLARAAMADDTFAELVGERSARLPVAGTVHNTDSLLGTHGFVGIKTGSDDAAGGCFMFQTWRLVGGHNVAVTGVVLGQRGHDLIKAGLHAAAQLADRVAPSAAHP